MNRTKPLITIPLSEALEDVFSSFLHEINSMQIQPVQWLIYNREHVSLLSVPPFSIKL